MTLGSFSKLCIEYTRVTAILFLKEMIRSLMIREMERIHDVNPSTAVSTLTISEEAF